MDEAKERVEQELDELSERIAKLSAFLSGRNLLGRKFSTYMCDLMRKQLETMKKYAAYLQLRLEMWGKTDKGVAKYRKQCDTEHFCRNWNNQWLE